MNKTRIITIICWCISAITLTGLALWFIFASPLFGSDWGRWGGNNWSWGLSIENLTGSFEPAGSYDLQQGGIDSIDISWVAGAITITPHDGDSIIITELTQRELSDNERMSVTTSGSTVTVSFTDGTRIGNMPSKRLEVLVPQPLSDNLAMLSVSASSGSMSVSGITATLIDLGSTSGGFTITNVNAGSILLNSTSGTINISDSSAEELRTNATSGTQNISGSFNEANIRGTSGRLTFVSDADNSSVTANVTSGAQDITGSFDTVDIGGTSGTKTILSRIVPSSLRVDSTSGRIYITIPNEGAISVHHSTSSGRFSSDIPVMMQAGDAAFRISSTSGNVNINELR